MSKSPRKFSSEFNKILLSIFLRGIIAGGSIVVLII